MKTGRGRRFHLYLLDVATLSLVSFVLYVISPVSMEGDTKVFFPLLTHISLFVLCTTLAQLAFSTYKSLWRYADGGDFITLIIGMVIGSMLYVALAKILLNEPLPGLYMVSAAASGTTAMIFYRLVYRRVKIALAAKKAQSRDAEKRLTIIIGAGQAGTMLAKEMRDSATTPFKPCCFMDDDPELIGMKIFGLPVYGPISEVLDVAKKLGAAEIFLAMPSVEPERKKEILSVCAKTPLRIRVLPDRVSSIDPDQPLIKQARTINYEDLLGRPPVTLKNANIAEFVGGQTVLVTGGGGSIGSELCRQVAMNEPKKLVILDEYENGAYDIQQEILREHGEGFPLEVEIASVCDKAKIDRIFDRVCPDIVVHAAAHKHVPLMEHNPDEAVKNNIFGTYNIASAASRTNVSHFVMISTDKAVNPTSVMGATKRICELIVKSVGSVSEGEFVAVRFGNVLGSSGSVIPLFQKQIQQGGPVTITDRRIIRYFMTIPEAVQLVLQAGAMAKSAETFVLDMGEPVKIIELAENLIRLSGRVPYTDIPIVETGLRPGEKLYEELLIAEKGLEKTKNEKIYVERQKAVSQDTVYMWLAQLRSAVESSDSRATRDCIKRIVPEFHEPEIDVERRSSPVRLTMEDAHSQAPISLMGKGGN